jgi:hypothetical protein
MEEEEGTFLHGFSKRLARFRLLHIPFYESEIDKRFVEQ